MPQEKCGEGPEFALTILAGGYVVFDMGPEPPAVLVEHIRGLAAAMADTGVCAETRCLTVEERDAIVRRLAAVLAQEGQS